jgi:hypothetical protein
MFNNLLVVALLILVTATTTWADDQSTNVTVTVGTFTESGTRRFDYTATYAVLETEIDYTPIRLQFDHFSNPTGLAQVWLNAGRLELCDDPNFQLSVSPSIIVRNDGHIFYGGFLKADFPGLGLSIMQKSYAGNLSDKHITIVTLGPLMYYRLAQQNYKPDSYLGPQVTLGNLFLWAGFSTNRPGATAINLEFSQRF